MPMELQGFDNLKDDLTNMASNLEFGAGVNRALQEGAKPIEEQMLHTPRLIPKSSPARCTVPFVPTVFENPAVVASTSLSA